jgi:hypothetical protein
MADIIDAAIERLETKKKSRVQAKIDAGKAVRVAPIIVAGLCSGDIERDRARRRAELRAAGETREIIFGLGSDGPEVIATGVNRGPRDDRAALERREIAPKPYAVALESKPIEPPRAQDPWLRASRSVSHFRLRSA